jgi:hypothetical protein
MKAHLLTHRTPSPTTTQKSAHENYKLSPHINSESKQTQACNPHVRSLLLQVIITHWNHNIKPVWKQTVFSSPEATPFDTVREKPVLWFNLYWTQCQGKCLSKLKTTLELRNLITNAVSQNLAVLFRLLLPLLMLHSKTNMQTGRNDVFSKEKLVKNMSFQRQNWLIWSFNFNQFCPLNGLLPFDKGQAPNNWAISTPDLTPISINTYK